MNYWQDDYSRIKHRRREFFWRVFILFTIACSKVYILCLLISLITSVHVGSNCNHQVSVTIEYVERSSQTPRRQLSTRDEMPAKPRRFPEREGGMGISTTPVDTDRGAVCSWKYFEIRGICTVSEEFSYYLFSSPHVVCKCRAIYSRIGIVRRSHDEEFHLYCYIFIYF